MKIIYADPPWKYADPADAGKRGAGHQYKVMELRDIARLSVWDMASSNCFLAMWWTMPLAQEALDLVKFLGFKVKTMGGFTWVKTNVSGKHPIGMGYWTRTNAECCLFATRGKIKRESAAVPALVNAPRGLHSQKPPVVADHIVKLMGDHPRVELFARDFKPGWHSWGNELPPTISGNARPSDRVYYMSPSGRKIVEACGLTK